LVGGLVFASGEGLKQATKEYHFIWKRDES
jgi:hypothetical protein